MQLSICPRTYSRLVRTGMPHVLVLTARRYDLAEVTAWLRARTTRMVDVRRPRIAGCPDDQLVQQLKQLARGRR